MELQMVFNELSVEFPAEDIDTARFWMHSLLGTINAVSRRTKKIVIRSHIDLNNTLLAENYPMGCWRNDSSVDIELRRLFRSLITQHPALSDLPESEDEAYSYDFKCGGKIAQGFKYSHLIDGLVLSFPSGYIWEESNILLNADFLNDHDEIQPITVKINNASTSRNIVELEPWIFLRTDEEEIKVRNGEELIHYKEKLFPNIIFSETIIADLKIITCAKLIKNVQFYLSLLNKTGLMLGFPYCSKLKGAEKNLRELRLPEAYRIIYTFTPDRKAKVLLGGCKAGDNNWYNANIASAEGML